METKVYLGRGRTPLERLERDAGGTDPSALPLLLKALTCWVGRFGLQRDEADDIVQNAFLRALETKKAKEATWSNSRLYCLVRYEVLSWRKGCRRRLKNMALFARNTPKPSVPSPEMRVHLRKRLAALPADGVDRCIMDAWAQGYIDCEIASILAVERQITVTAQGIRQRRHRLREAMQI